MASVAQLTNADSDIQYYTCANATGIAKGTLLQMTDPFTVSAQSAVCQVIAGVAAEEKVANDGSTRIAVRVRGRVTMKADGAITVGNLLVSGAAANEVMPVGVAAVSFSDVVLGHVLGKAEESVADTEDVQVMLMLG